MATGHIRRRISSKGCVSYQVVVEGEADPMTGKRDRHYKTVNGTKKQADAMMRKMIAEVEAGGLTVSSPQKLRDWMHEWLDLYLPNIEASTRAGYEEKIRNYIDPALGGIALKSLKTANIQTMVNDLSYRGLAPKTIKNAYLNLHAALEKAAVLKMIPYNPCLGVELPKMKTVPMLIFTAKEMQQVLMLLKGTSLYLPFLLSIYLGLRRGELCALTWDDVDLEHGVIHIRRSMVVIGKEAIIKEPKTEAGIRDVSIGDEIIEVLKEARVQYLKDKLAYGAGFDDSGYVIRSEKGKHYRPDSITQAWVRFRKQHGLKPVTWHGLRHSCATAMIESGVDPKTVQQRLGHKDIKTTMIIYAHCTKAMNDNAAKKLDEVILG